MRTSNYRILHADIYNETSAWLTYAEGCIDDDDFCLSCVHFCVMLCDRKELQIAYSLGVQSLLRSRPKNPPHHLSTSIVSPDDLTVFVESNKDISNRLRAVLDFVDNRSKADSNLFHYWFTHWAKTSDCPPAILDTVRGCARRFYSAVLVEAFNRVDKVTE